MSASIDSRQLLPLIRSRIEFELVRVRAAQDGVDDPKDLPVSFRVFANEMAVTIVQDLPDEFQAMSERDLEAAGLDFAKALPIATANLKKSLPEEGDHFRRVADGYYVPHRVGDIEPASLLLLHEAINKLGVKGNPVAFAPDTDTVWITGRDEAKVLKRLAAASLKHAEQSSDHRLIPIPLELDGQKWKPLMVAADHPAAEEIRQCWLAHRAAIYDAQQSTLDEFAGDDDPLVGSFAMGPPEPSAGTKPYSFSILMEGIATMVPRSDYVVLQRVSDPVRAAANPSAEHGETCAVKWSVFAKTLGGQLKPAKMYPERYLVSQFPTGKAWEELKRQKVDLERRSASNPHQLPLTPLPDQSAPMLQVGHLSQPAKTTAPVGPAYHQQNAGGGSGWLWWLAGGGTLLCLLGCIGAGGVAAVWYMYNRGKEISPVARAERDMAESRQELSRPERGGRPNTARIQPNNRNIKLEDPPRKPELDDSDVEFPKFSPLESELHSASMGDFWKGQEFSSTAPEGGILVGFQYGIDGDWGGCLGGLRPIYQVGKQYHGGKWGGLTELVSSDMVLARPGYAIGAIHIDSGLAIDSMQLEFFKLDGNRLDRTDSYKSDWIGGEGRGEEVLSAGSGVIVGVDGVYSDYMTGLTIHSYTPLPAVEQPLEKVEVERPVDIGKVGESRPSATDYDDQAPLGGILVGLRIYTGDSWSGVFDAVQPIYQVQDQYVLGTRIGPEGGEMHELIAEPGYAVGGFSTKRGLVLNCIQLTYYRFEGGKLDPTDDYRSDWIGVNSGNLEKLDGDEKPIVGVFGNASDNMHSLGLICAD